MIARIVAALLLTTLPLKAHEWYSYGCCGTRDCASIEDCDELAEQKDGSYIYKPTGDRFDKEHVYPSQDKKCHVCIGISGTSRIPRCIFIMQGT